MIPEAPEAPVAGAGDRDPNSTIARAERCAPRSAGIAGIAFSVLFVASMLVLSPRPPDGLDDAGEVTSAGATFRPVPRSIGAAEVVGGAFALAIVLRALARFRR